MFVGATPGCVLGVPGFAKDVDPNTGWRHERGVEIDKDVARRGAEIPYLGGGSCRELVAKLAVADTQVADRAGRLKLRPVGGRKAIDVERSPTGQR